MRLRPLPDPDHLPALDRRAALVRPAAGLVDPSDLPLPDRVAGDDHPAVHELRALSMWSEAHVWCSPERHGRVTGLINAQIDHLPPAHRGIRPTQGRTLAVMQVSGGSQSFNAVNRLRLVGRWMRMLTIPDQSMLTDRYSERLAATGPPPETDLATLAGARQPATSGA